MLSVKQGGIKYYFLAFGMSQPGIEPRSLGLLPIAWFIYVTEIESLVL